MTAESQEKPNLEKGKLLEKLEKENKRLAEENEGLKKQLIEFFEMSIASAEKMNLKLMNRFKKQQ